MLKWLKFIRGQKGLSVMEVTLFGGILLAAMAAGYQAIQSGALSRKKAKQFGGYIQFVNYFKTVGTNQFNCGIGLGILNPSTGQAGNAPLALSPAIGGSRAISIFSPTGENYEKNDVIGMVKIKELSLNTEGSGTDIPGTNDKVYRASLKLAGEKTGAFSGGLPPVTIPLSLRVNSNNQLVSCSSYRQSNQELLPSPPCDQYSVSSVTPDGNSVTCKKVFCKNGEAPIGYTADGQVECESIPECTGRGKGVVKIRGHWVCKQLSCPETSRPLPSRMDADGFISECSDLRSVIKDCSPNSQTICKPLYSPHSDPGATKGYFCDTSPPDENKFCKEECSTKSSEGFQCELVNRVHTAAQCLQKGGYLVPDPNAATATTGRVLCAMAGTHDQNCWSGWNLYGKTYRPDLGICPNPIPVGLDWNGRDGCWPNCAGQGDTFPDEFRGTKSCKAWLMAKGVYQEDPDTGKTILPPILQIPQGFYEAGSANKNTNSYGCIMSFNCKICGNVPLTSWEDFWGNVATIPYGLITLVELGNLDGFKSVSWNSTDGTYEYASETCVKPNVSYVFSRCDINCYSGGVSSCHMEPSTNFRKVNFDVTTYCY